jgi:hypothetical protein
VSALAPRVLLPLLAAALLALALGCSGSVSASTGPAKPPAPGPGPAPSGTACERGCARLQELECAAYAPDCVPACQNIESRYQRRESALTLNPSCLALIATCTEADTICRQ